MILIIGASLWLIFVLFYFWVMLLKYPLKDWGYTPNPYIGESLGLPKGSIRAILALSMLFMFILVHSYDIAFEGINTHSVDQATSLVLAYYFANQAIGTIIKWQRDPESKD